MHRTYVSLHICNLDSVVRIAPLLRVILARCSDARERRKVSVKREIGISGGAKITAKNLAGLRPLAASPTLEIEFYLAR